ncbi:MAG: single-stranded-DNA-specific exonuclease RecJ [Planctomycetota bacterium]
MRAFQPKPTDSDAAAELAKSLALHPVTAQLLVTRGYDTVEHAKRFLSPRLEQLHAPGELKDMDRAVAKIVAAIENRQRIAIYGDYDVDGVCSTAVLMRALEALGAKPKAFIPHRVHDGYGLNGAALKRLRDDGIDLVVTVDNGTTRAAEIAEARESGMEMVVTDHHEPNGDLPDCPVVNPKRADASYPFSGLAGCGVAFKLAQALASQMEAEKSPEFRALWPDLLALVAIGTVADIVPLLDENRVIVRAGLQALAATKQPGLKALLKVARLDGRRVFARDIGFKIGPRINAAGRIGTAQLALDLLLCDDDTEAAELAGKLDAANRERQQMERRQSDEAMERAQAEIEATNAPALVLADESWHAGLVGIIAMRVAEKFERPTICIAIDGEIARGSARSFGGVFLHDALNDCTEHLLSHGGHAFAAGCTIQPENIDAFRTAFVAAVEKQPRDAGGPQEVDAELPIDAIHASLAGEIDRFRPFGAGNPEPVFCACGVRAAGKPRRLGAAEKHLSFYAAGEQQSLRAIAFSQADSEPLLKAPVDLAYVLRPGQGADSIELQVRRIVASHQ